MCSVLAAPGADGGVGKARQAGYLQRRTGHQFTEAAFIGALPGHGITISMDGKGAWRDNVFVDGCGAASNTTRRSICTPTTACPKHALRSVAASIFYNCRRPQQP